MEENTRIQIVFASQIDTGTMSFPAIVKFVYISSPAQTKCFQQLWVMFTQWI